MEIQVDDEDGGCLGLGLLAVLLLGIVARLIMRPVKNGRSRASD